MRGNEKQFKETRLIIVLLSVIIILLLGVITLLLAKDNKQSTILEPNKVEKKEEEPEESKDEKEKEQNDKDVNIELDKGTINSEKDEDTKEVKINNNIITISYSVIRSGQSIEQYIKANDSIVASWGPTGGPSNIEYESFIASDGKEYLVLTYNMWGSYTYIIDENANVIKSVDELAKLKDGNECYMSHNKKLNRIEENYFYYYKYHSGEIVGGNNYDSKLKIEEMKVTINNGKISEESTGKIIESSFGQCN